MGPGPPEDTFFLWAFTGEGAHPTVFREHSRWALGTLCDAHYRSTTCKVSAFPVVLLLWLLLSQLEAEMLLKSPPTHMLFFPLYWFVILKVQLPTGLLIIAMSITISSTKKESTNRTINLTCVLSRKCQRFTNFLIKHPKITVHKGAAYQNYSSMEWDQRDSTIGRAFP